MIKVIELEKKPMTLMNVIFIKPVSRGILKDDISLGYGKVEIAASLILYNFDIVLLYTIYHKVAIIDKISHLCYVIS